MNIIDLLADIHTLNKELIAFEYKYGLLSDIFYDWYSQGHEPENDTWLIDSAEWAGLYRSRQRLTEQYHRILRQQLQTNQETIVSHLRERIQVANV
jgi:hypothetical protein